MVSPCDGIIILNFPEPVWPFEGFKACGFLQSKLISLNIILSRPYIILTENKFCLRNHKSHVNNNFNQRSNLFN